MNVNRRVKWSLASGCAAVALAGAGAIAFNAGAAEENDAPTKPEPAYASVLGSDTAQDASAALPPSYAESRGFVSAGSRIALTTDRGIRLVVTTQEEPTGDPGAGPQICLLAMSKSATDDPNGPGSSSGGCIAVNDFNSDGLFTTNSNNDGSVDVYGLVPDGVESVSLTFGDQAPQQLKVVNNAYTAHVDEVVKATVAFETSSGPVKQSIVPVRG